MVIRNYLAVLDNIFSVHKMLTCLILRNSLRRSLWGTITINSWSLRGTIRVYSWSLGCTVAVNIRSSRQRSSLSATLRVGAGSTANLKYYILYKIIYSKTDVKKRIFYKHKFLLFLFSQVKM